MQRQIFLFIGLLILLTNSCSKSAAPRNFKLVLGAEVTGLTINGGAIAKLVNTVTGENFIVKMNAAPYETVIPNGTWDIYLVGFAGPGSWQGSTYCGGQMAQVLSGADADVTISANQQNCYNTPYPILISAVTAPASSWDSGLWEQATWGQ